MKRVFVHLYSETYVGGETTSVSLRVEGGQLRYANTTRDRGHARGERETRDAIRHVVCLSPLVLGEVARLIEESGILEYSDRAWPRPDDHLQELEVELDRRHGKRYRTNKLISLGKIAETRDPEGLKCFYHVTHDLRALLMACVTAHFKKRPL